MKQPKILGKDAQVWGSSKEIAICGCNVSWKLAVALPRERTMRVTGRMTFLVGLRIGQALTQDSPECCVLRVKSPALPQGI